MYTNTSVYIQGYAEFHEEVNIAEVLLEAPGYIFWKNLNSVYMWCNQNGAELYGVDSPNQVIGKTDYDFNQIYADEFIKHDKFVIETGFVHVSENDIVVTPNGKELTLKTIKKPLHSKSGSIIGVLGISIDITDTKEKERQYARAESESALRKSITTFADAIGHNQRSPLGLISLYLQLYKTRINTLEKFLEEAGIMNLSAFKEMEQQSIVKYLTVEYPNIIQELLQKAHEIINSNLKNLRTAISIHNGEHNNDDLSICEISTTLSMLNNYSNFQDLIEIEQEYKFKYRGNIILLEQIISNLMTNSLYQINKNMKGSIFIKTEDGGEINILRFRDTAGGASADIVSQMFNSHFTTKGDQGNGVGLDYCKKIMHFFGGDIVAHSVEGEFMEFILSFPKIIERE